MARFARVVVPGCPHHITHRGNRGDPVFYAVGERKQYCGWLREYADKHSLRIWAYCLMPNHVHLIAFAENSHSLARAVGHTHRRFSSWMNGRHGWTGHLWANRFFSTPMDAAHLWAAVRYVELNPVRAGLVDDPLEYRWSSAPAHCGQSSDPLLHRSRPFPGHIKEWKAWLLAGCNENLVHELRTDTATGRPCGSSEFVSLVEKKLDRRLRRERRGPKPRGTRQPSLP